MQPSNGSAPLLLKRAKLEGRPGVLTISRDAVSWQPDDPAGSQQPASVAVSAITNQQRAKGKPFLRMVTLGRPFVFELESVEDVDAVVDTLAPLLPRAAVGTPKGPDAQADLKAKLLKDDADLNRLYEQLVLSGVLSAEEFWRGRSHLLKAGRVTAEQRVGLSSAMLTEMQPNPDGKSDTVKVKLTAAMVHQIFAEKPHVQRAFQANVPTRIMTHNQFWAKYLRHQLLQQNARRAGTSADRSYQEEAEFFAKYEREEDEAAQRPAGPVNPADDLTADRNDDTYTGYGIHHSSRQDPVDTRKSGKGSLIKDINRHAEVVMGGTPASLPADAADAAATLAASAPASLQGPSREMQDAAQRPAPGGSGLEDLRQQPVPDFSRLQVQDPRTAFNAAAASSDAATDSNSADVWEAARAAHEALLGISCTQLDIGMPDDLALQVLVDIMHDSEGSSTAAGGAAEALLPQVVEMLRQRVLTVNELLRHMWACFPLASQQRQTKAARLASALSSQQEGLQRMEEAASGGERRHIALLLRPLTEAIDMALTKHEAAKADALSSQP